MYLFWRKQFKYGQNQPRSKNTSFIESMILNSKSKTEISLSVSITSWAVIQCKGCVNLQLYWENSQIKWISIEKGFCWANGLISLLWLSRKSMPFPLTDDRGSWWMLVMLTRALTLRDMKELQWSFGVWTKHLNQGLLNKQLFIFKKNFHG